MTRLELFISHVRIQIESNLDSAAKSLQAIWEGASAPYVPTSRVESFRIEPDRHGWSILRGEQTMRAGLVEVDVPPALEGEVYKALLDWHSHQTLFHAACVARDEQPVLFVGRSGSGKSSLALVAMRAGFEYFGDEHVVTDGHLIWGIPRAVQFDVVGAGARLPGWLSGADVASYRLHDREGARKVLPFVSVSGRVARQPLPAERLRVVFVRQTEHTRLLPRLPLAALHGLHEATLGTPHVALGKLVGPGRAFDLEWSDPYAAIELLS
jgi:hypothetical protein